MNSCIFLIGVDNELTELTRSPYDSEDMLQRLIATHPKVLGAATGADGGLLLVQSEHGVPDAQDGSGRWSLDHLFLDRNSVPTLVEVKRATDTRARREVVAQMLDYAANGVAYWPIDGIVHAFRASCEAGGLDPDTRLAEFLGDDDPEDFWKATEANLRSGRIDFADLIIADNARFDRPSCERLSQPSRPWLGLARIPRSCGMASRGRSWANFSRGAAGFTKATRLRTITMPCWRCWQRPCPLRLYCPRASAGVGKEVPPTHLGGEQFLRHGGSTQEAGLPLERGHRRPTEVMVGGG
jgi:hypothetical protein